jgi:hypothetical protein
MVRVLRRVREARRGVGSRPLVVAEWVDGFGFDVWLSFGSSWAVCGGHESLSGALAELVPPSFRVVRARWPGGGVVDLDVQDPIAVGALGSALVAAGSAVAVPGASGRVDGVR